MADENATDEASASVEVSKIQSEHDRAMVGHAVAHLNNLLPRFGSSHRLDGYQAHAAPEMDDAPEPVRRAAERATVAAARYLEAAFDLERRGVEELAARSGAES